jgi:hypothetical protein
LIRAQASGAIVNTKRSDTDKNLARKKIVADNGPRVLPLDCLHFRGSHYGNERVWV